MAELQAKFAPFTASNLDMGGVRAVLKSGAVESQLMSKAQTIAAGCNSICYADRGSKGHIRSDEAPFNAWTNQGGYTAFGHVSTVNLEGIRFEHKTKVLEMFNH